MTDINFDKLKENHKNFASQYKDKYANYKFLKELSEDLYEKYDNPHYDGQMMWDLYEQVKDCIAFFEMAYRELPKDETEYRAQVMYFLDEFGHYDYDGYSLLEKPEYIAILNLGMANGYLPGETAADIDEVYGSRYI